MKANAMEEGMKEANEDLVEEANEDQQDDMEEVLVRPKTKKTKVKHSPSKYYKLSPFCVTTLVNRD